MNNDLMTKNKHAIIQTPLELFCTTQYQEKNQEVYTSTCHLSPSLFDALAFFVTSIIIRNISFQLRLNTVSKT